MTYRLVVDRYHQREEIDGYETLDAAVGAMRWGEDDGAFYGLAILNPQGEAVMERAEPDSPTTGPLPPWEALGGGLPHE